MSKGECVTYFVERFLAGRIWEWSEEEAAASAGTEEGWRKGG